MGRIRNTIELAKTSWAVLKKDRELLWFPVLSFLASIVVIVVIASPVIAMIDTTTTAGGEETTVSPAVAVLGVLGALALSVVSVFFNGALVAGAHERLRGGDPTVRSALSRAFSRIPGLVPWALLTATVGLILQALRERAGGLARFVVSLVGTAWDVATFLVVPAVIVDELGAVEGLKRSGSLLKRTWGENLAARVGFGLLGIVAVIPAVLLVLVAVATGVGVFLVVGVIAAVAWIAVVVVVLTALNAVFQTALYLYATTGSVPSGFESSPLPQSFGQR
ncbi:MAG: DUF6159 family protein [Acidimicrobiales bacterium]